MPSRFFMELETPQSSTSVDNNINLSPRYVWNEKFRLEGERLKTFENWPLKWLDKNILATTGMFYTGSKDHTKCYFCEIVICKWLQNDDPVQEHLRWSQNCPLLRRRTTDNIALNEKSLDLLLPPAKHVTYDTPPCGTWKPIPSHDYSIIPVRLHSFSEWPVSIKQRPKELVDAGFYYKGIGDCVTCFSCLGSLKDWEEDDDPWEQHALWMGHYCPYVKLRKGEEYVSAIYNKFKNYQPKEEEKTSKQNQMMAQKATTCESDDKLCKICFDKQCDTVYLPCGHVIACEECAMKADDCPVCRGPIENRVHLYFS